MNRAIAILMKAGENAKSRLQGFFEIKDIADWQQLISSELAQAAVQLNCAGVVVAPSGASRGPTPPGFSRTNYPGEGYWPAVAAAGRWACGRALPLVLVVSSDLAAFEVESARRIIDQADDHALAVACNLQGNLNTIAGPAAALAEVGALSPERSDIEALRAWAGQRDLKVSLVDSLALSFDVDCPADVLSLFEHLRIERPESPLYAWLGHHIAEVRTTRYGRLFFRPTAAWWEGRVGLLPLSKLLFSTTLSSLGMRRLREGLERDGVLLNPVLADRRSGLILDGQHRVAALAALGCGGIPCQLVDYLSAQVTLRNWYRRLVSVQADAVLDAMRREGIEVGPLVGDGPVLRAGDERWGLYPPRPASLRDMYAIVAMVERTVGKLHGEVELWRDDWPLEAASLRAHPILLPPPPCGKQQSLDCARTRDHWPANANRALVQHRLLGLEIPIELLSGADARRRLSEHLASLWLQPQPDNCFGPDRLYSEPTLVATPFLRSEL